MASLRLIGTSLNRNLTFARSINFRRSMLPVHSRFLASAPVGKHIKTKVVDNVLVVSLDSPNSKVNSLGAEVQAEFDAVFRDMETNPAVTSAVVISAKPGCFIAGADISMLEKCKSAEEATKISHEGQLQFNRLEKSRKPIVAAINGVCLGGGLELALACHYRVAVKDKRTNLGLPEVMLGLLPGAGGTQRLPKLTSIPTALDLALTAGWPQTREKREMREKCGNRTAPGKMREKVGNLTFHREFSLATHCKTIFVPGYAILCHPRRICR